MIRRIRPLAGLVLASAAYGFSIGASNSWTYAVWNLAKFPLLILATTAICSLSYFVLARFLGVPLSFARVQRLVLAVFRDLSVLLAGLAPAVLFLALTMARPHGDDLAEYPLFQGLNVALIAVCGCTAVRRQGKDLLRRHGIAPRPGAALLLGWMALSLLAGGQCAWYLRPFFGTTPPAPGQRFCDGSRPDFRGARSIYEAVYNLVALPARR